MQSEASAILDSLIDEKVRAVLIGALGITEFTDLDSQIDNGVLKNDADQKWKDLVNGKTYDGKKWNGLLYTMGGVKKSLLANYVFYFYMSEDTTSYTGIGVAKQQGKNTQIVSNVPRLVKAWNTFLEGYQGFSDGRLPKVQYRDGLTYVDFLNNGTQVDTGERSLLRFLSDHSDVYENVSRQTYPMANRYGL
jgi:hypothetical protein